MATFSENQVRHLFVEKDYVAPQQVSSADSNSATAVWYQSASADLGDMTVLKTSDGKSMYFMTKGQGGAVRSDLIDFDKIIYTKATNYAAMARKGKAVQIKLNPNIKDSSNNVIPVAGEDYILNILIKQFSSLGEADTYQKFGAVRAVASMTASDFYKAMATSLVRNFSRELVRFFDFYLVVSGNEVAANTIAAITAAGTATALIIKEHPQIEEYKTGLKAVEDVNFEVSFPKINYNGDEVDGLVMNASGESKDSMGQTIVSPLAYVTTVNGYDIADMEYFYLGERADLYRNIGWPKSIPSKTMITDPTKPYNTIDIHYYYEGGNESCQKSEKTITIVAESGTTGTNDCKILGDLCEKINTYKANTISYPASWGHN